MNRSIRVILILALTIIGTLSIITIPVTADEDEDGGIDISDPSEIQMSQFDINLDRNDIDDEVDTDGVDGQLRYDVTLTGTVQQGHYPILYPITITYYDTTEDDIDGGADVVGAKNTFLTPTQPDSFIPGDSGQDFNNRQMVWTSEVTLNFEDLFDEDDDAVNTKEVTARAESTRSNQNAEYRDVADITGPLPDGTSDGVVDPREDIDVDTDVTFVDSFRISENVENRQFGEDLSIPTPGYSELRGQMSDFTEVSNALGDSSMVSGGEDGISFVTLTEGAGRGSPQTLAVTYDLIEGEEVTLTPMNPSGQETVQPTEYTLPSDPDEEEACREIDVGDTDAISCVFYLNDGEVDSINDLGELMVHYESEERTDFALGCQSVIAGYLPVEDQACGVNPFDSQEDPSPEPILSVDLEGTPSDNLEEVSDSEWEDEEVQVGEIFQDTEAPHSLRYSVSGNIDDDNFNSDTYVHVYDEEQLEIDDGLTVREGEDPHISDRVDSLDEWNEFEDVNELPTNENLKYHAILCEDVSNPDDIPNDNCDLGELNNLDQDDVQFLPLPIDGELIINEPVVINPLEINEIEDWITIRNERVETIDEEFDDNPDWRQVGSDPIIEDFEGTLTQVVSVRGAGEEEVSIARSGGVIEEAEELRSDPDSSLIDGWEHEVQISELWSEERYVPSTEGSPGAGWTDATTFSQRSVEIDSETDTFPIITESNFASQVEAQERWYPLRDEDGIRDTTEFVLDTVLRAEDPDNCLNCLPTEDELHASARLEQSTGAPAEVIQSTTDSTWSEVDGEPVVRTGMEQAQTFYRSDDIVGDTLFYQNIGQGETSDNRFRMREPIEEVVELSEWEYSPEILESPFERPIMDQTDRYVAGNYDITYTFTTEVTEPSDLYEFEGSVEQPVIDYEDGHIAWVDISQSDSEEFYQFEVEFEGADNEITVGWDDDVHEHAPHELDETLEQVCDTSPENNFDNDNPVTKLETTTVEDADSLEYMDSSQHGISGNAVVQTCDIDGEETVVRVGKEYTEPGVFSFDVDVTGLQGDSGEDTGVNEVIGEAPEGEDRQPPEIGSSPDITSIETVNDRTDFRIGMAAFQGTVTSPTHQLDGDYEITVNPADDVDASGVSCGELGDYSQRMETVNTESFQTGDSYRQTERCIREGFIDTEEAPDAFMVQETRLRFDEEGEEVDEEENVAFELPPGAIQTCSDPLSGDDEDCYVPEDVFDNHNEDHHIEFGSPDTGWETVDPVDEETPALGTSCPLGYESSVETVDDDPEWDIIYENRCVTEGELDIELRTRLITDEYETVEGGEITECTDIPAVGSDGDHDGYVTESDENGIECIKQDSSDPGPEPVTLSEVDTSPFSSGEEFVDVEAGAVRGTSPAADQEPEACESTRVEDDGSLICDLEDGDEIRYGVRQEGTWTSTSDEVSDLIDQSDARKTVWSGDHVLDVEGRWEESFTAVINPRRIGESLDNMDDNTVEFTFELRETSTSNVVATEDVAVEFCEAGQVGSIDELPRGTMGENECENFDSIMTGFDDWQVDNVGDDLDDDVVPVKTVQEAVEHYTEFDNVDADNLEERGSVEYVIESVANDACPYSHEFPRDHESLIENPEAFTYELEADTSADLQIEEERMREEVQSQLMAQYSPLEDDPCERSIDEFDQPTAIQDTPDIEVSFDKRHLLQSGDVERDFSRIAGLSDLHQIVPNPVQSRWADYDLGSSIRMGSPVLLDQSPSAVSRGMGENSPEAHEMNENLVSHYTFDHDPTRHTTRSEIPELLDDGESVTTIPNHFTIQDVGMIETHESPDGTETALLTDFEDDDYISRGIYNARLWYGSPCHEGLADRVTTDGVVFNPDSMQPISGEGPDAQRDHRSYEECTGMMSSEEAQEISQYDYIANPRANVLNNAPRHALAGYYGGISGIDRLTNEVPDDQSAYLPIEPTSDWQDQYDVEEGEIKDAYEAVESNYAERRGVFGGNALRVEDSSWLMITPPCYEAGDIGNTLQQVGMSNIGHLGTTHDSCETETPDPDETWRGGWAESYTEPDNQLESSSLHDELDDEYAVSFWVNSEESRSDSHVWTHDGEATAATDNMFSTSRPVVNDWQVETGNTLLNTNQLSTVEVPNRIDIGDLSSQDKQELESIYDDVDTSLDSVEPTAWDYPSHFNLRDTARACMRMDEDFASTFSVFGVNIPTLDDSDRPIMCEIFERSDSVWAEDYDDLTEYGGEDLSGPLDEPDFLADFRQEFVGTAMSEGRIEYTTTYDWPAGSAILPRQQDGFPDFDTNNIRIRETGDICYHATQRGCYEDGRYVFGSGDTERANMRADHEIDSSGWQHIAISYDTSSDEPVQVYINGDQVSDIQTDDGMLGANDAFGDEEIQVGELYEDGIMSIGAVYQGAGYGFNPNEMDDSGDYVPYIHASRNSVLIDELRIYDDSMRDDLSFPDNEIPDLEPPEIHGLHSTADLYTSEFNTESPVWSGEEDNLIAELDDIEQDMFTSWEFELEVSSEGPAAYEVEIIPCETEGIDENCAYLASETVDDDVIPEGLGARSTEDVLSDFDWNEFYDPLNPIQTPLLEDGDTEASEEELLTSQNYELIQGGGGGSIEEQTDLEQIHQESQDMVLSDNIENINFDPEAIDNAGVDEINSFKFNVNLGTPFVDSTPVIRDITARPMDDPYPSCQALAEDHPGSDGLYGSEFRMDLIDQAGFEHEALCDMRTAGGEWTKFAWFDVSEGQEFDHDIPNDEPVFTEEMRRSECDLDDDNACFATADFDDIPEGENPQIMIKSVDDGETVDWAAFEFSEDVHEVIEEDLGVDEIEWANSAADIFSGDIDSATDDAPFNTVGQDSDQATETSDDIEEHAMFDQCIHPFDDSSEQDTRCISHLYSDNGDELITSQFSIARLSEVRMQSPDTATLEDHIFRAIINHEDNRIEGAENGLDCLGSEVERCEFYYRTGDASDPFSQNSTIRPQGTFDPEDYEFTQPNDEGNQWFARGYTFGIEYETEISSIHTAANSPGVGWVGIYESLPDGALGDKIESVDVQRDGPFEEVQLNNNITLDAGEDYAIVQGFTDSDASHYLYTGPQFNMGLLTGENPLDSFEPAEEGESFRYRTQSGEATGTAQEYEGSSPIDNSRHAPRIGFDFRITDTEFVEASGGLDDEWISVTDEIVGHYVTEGSRIVAEDTSAVARGYRIVPDEEIRINSIGIGYESICEQHASYAECDVDENPYDLNVWGAVYETDVSGNPQSIVDSAVVDMENTDNANLQYEDMNDAILSEGEEYIIAIGGTDARTDWRGEMDPRQGSLVGLRPGFQVYVDEGSWLIPDSEPEVSWDSISRMEVSNQEAIAWDRWWDRHSVGGEDPDQLLDRSPDRVPTGYPNIGLRYEYIGQTGFWGGGGRHPGIIR